MPKKREDEDEERIKSLLFQSSVDAKKEIANIRKYESKYEPPSYKPAVDAEKAVGRVRKSLMRERAPEQDKRPTTEEVLPKFKTEGDKIEPKRAPMPAGKSLMNRAPSSARPNVQSKREQFENDKLSYEQRKRLADELEKEKRRG